MKSYKNLLLLMIPVALAACSGAKETSKSQGYVSKLDDRWKKDQIGVCFTQAVPQVTRDIIASALNGEYGKVGFAFQGFGSCATSASDIKVSFIPGSSSTANGFGAAASTVKLGTGHACSDSAGKPVSFLSSNCLRNVALHEFGHVLGLHHEMNRRDNNGSCRLDQTLDRGEASALQLGDYDSQSVMNYCYVFAVNNSNTAVPLSSGDIATLNAVYDGPIAGFSSLPAASVSRLADIQFKVVGKGLTAFQVKFGAAGTVDCKTAAGYQDYTDLELVLKGDELAQTFLDATQPRQGDFKICLIGKDETRIQNYVSYSSIDVYVAGI